MKKYVQYSLLSLFGVMFLIATGMSVWCWDADQERIRAAEQLQQIVARWNRTVDQFEKKLTRFHQPTAEVQVLVRLMRQNPHHELWKEVEYAPIFSGQPITGLGGVNLSWPQQTIQLGEESVHVMTSQNPCLSRKLLVHTDAANRILDVKRVDDIIAFEKLKFQIRETKPYPVIRLTYLQQVSNNPVVLDLTLKKSSVQRLDPEAIKIIERLPE